MTDVFVSYARSDAREFVARLSAALAERGKDTWVDLEDIPAASVWNDDLRAGIASSDSFCFVISPASVSSEHCRTELEYAVGLGKRLLPVLHLPVPDAAVPEALAVRNWIPQTGRFDDDFDASLATLVTAIETDLDWVREHTRWGLRATEWEARAEERSLLARGSDLDQAEAFLSGGGGKEPQPTELQGRYVLASRRAATRRQRQLVTGVSVALVVAIVLGVLALLQRNNAVEQRHEAEKQRAAATSRALAANALLNLPTDPELSVLLGLQAAKASRTAEAESALRSGILDDRVRATLHHDEIVTSASYSPDGKRVVTTSADNTAALWDAETGDRVAVLSGHTQPPTQARWSADGTRLVTIAPDSTARVWDGRTGAPVSVITDQDDYRLTDVAISSDGSVVVTSGFVHQHIHFWNATTGAMLGTIPRDTVDRIALSPDNSLLLVAQQQVGVELFSTSDGSMVANYPEDAQSFFTAATFSSDGRLFATAGADGTARVRNLTGDLLAEVHHSDTITDLAFSPDGALLATSSDDGTAKITDLSDGALLSTVTGHEGSVSSVAFSRDGTLVATGGDDGVIDEWLPGSGALAITLAGHAAQVSSVEFSPISDRLVSASFDRTARIWDASLSSGAFERQDLTPLGVNASGGYSDDGSHAIYSGQGSGPGGTLYSVLDVAARSTRPAFELDGEQTLLPALSDDGDLAVTSNLELGSPKAEVRSTADGSVVSTLAVDGGIGAAFDKPGKRVVVTGADGSAAIFDVASGKKLVTLEGHDPALMVTSAAFSPDGKRVATAGEDLTARLWDAESGKLLTTIPAYTALAPRTEPTTYLAFSPDGQRLITASLFSDYASLWDVSTGELIGRMDGIITARDVAFSPDGQFLLISDFDGNVRLFDGENARFLSLVVDEPSTAFGVSFDTKGRSLQILTEQTDEGDAPTALDVLDCDICGGFGSLVALGESRVTRELTDTEKATYLSGD